MKITPGMTVVDFCKIYSEETSELIRSIGDEMEARKEMILATNELSDGSAEHHAAAETVLREIQEDARIGLAMLSRRNLVLESLLELFEPLL